jgi:hypothetical protein
MITTIQNQLHKNDKEKWYKLPAGVVILGVIVKVITHFMGV